MFRPLSLVAPFLFLSFSCACVHMPWHLQRLVTKALEPQSALKAEIQYWTVSICCIVAAATVQYWCYRTVLVLLGNPTHSGTNTTMLRVDYL